MGSRGRGRDFLELAALIGMKYAPNPFLQGLSVAVGCVISSLPVKTTRPKDEGETYSWSQAPNKTAANGTPMPVIYGKTRVKPTLKNRFITMEGKKQFLYALYSFSCHSIDERTVLPWVVGTMYIRGMEVTFPSEPGKTYYCKSSHHSTASGQYALFDPDGNLNPMWKEGVGTAAITDIMVNGEDITGLNQYGVQYWTRPGLATQSIIPNMNKTFANNSHEDDINVIYPNPVYVGSGGDKTFATVSGTRYWAEHHIYYDGVLYNVGKGNLVGATGTRYFYWTVPSDPTVKQTAYTVTASPLGTLNPGQFWIATWTTSDITPTMKWTSRTPTASEWHTYDIATLTTHALQVEFTLPNGLIGLTAGDLPVYAPGKVFVQYRINNGDGTFGTWTSGIDSVRHMGDPFDSIVDYGGGLVEGTLVRNTMEAINIILHIRDGESPLTQGMYQVRVATFIPATTILTNIAAITYGDFTYPGEALLGIKVLATNKFQGDIELTAVCKRSMVWVYTGTAWVQRPASNPACAVWDMLVQGNSLHPATNGMSGDVALQQATYGCGLDPSRVDYTSFSAWANLTSSLRYYLNTVFDSDTTIWDAIQRVCTEFRGSVFPIGTQYYAIRDRTETPAQLFSMGNIVEGSFNCTWPDRNKRAGSMELTYFDATRSYDRVTFLIRGTDWELQETLRMTLYGTTDYTQAYKIGRYFLKCNELLTNIVELDVGVSELQAGVGDVVYVQHDAPKQWGEGGKVTGYALDPDVGQWYVLLDKSITLAVGTTYYIYLKHSSSDVLEIQTVTGNGAMDYIFIAGTWAVAPAVGDVWAVGLATAGVRQFRIIDIARTGELMKHLTLLEYNPDVYTSDTITPGGGGTGSGVGKLALGGIPSFNTATGLRLSEYTSKRTTGEYQSNISVMWEAAQGNNFGEWEVMFRDVDASDIGWINEWARGTTYNQYEKITMDGKAYISLVDSNTGKPITL